MKNIKQYIFRSGVFIPTYIPEYQAVIDYAIANTITTPSHSQNLINEAIIQNLIWEELWSKLDLFYYAKYDFTAEGTEEFSQLNWVTPASYRLSSPAEPAYVDNEGWKINADSTHWRTGFIPSTDAIETVQDNMSIFWKLFDYPTTFSSVNSIFGGRILNDNTQLLVVNNIDGGILPRLFNVTNVSYTFGQSTINSHFHFSKTTVEELRFKEDDIDDTIAGMPAGSLGAGEVALLGFNDNGSWTSSGTGGMSYFAMGSGNTEFYQNEIYQIMNGTYYDKKVTGIGVEVLNVSALTVPTLWWLTIYKSSDFPAITTVKDYFCLWSTDHDPGDGGIWWGECDDLELTNFVENGLIVDGYQAEAGFLMYRDDDVDGHKVYLYYHTTTSDPDNGGYQQTHLLTCTGGALHSASWTQRGKVLGLIPDAPTENHTGYLIVNKISASSFVGIHTTRAGIAPPPPITYGKSTDTDGRSFTRISSDIDLDSFMPWERYYHHMGGVFFTRDSTQYVICRSVVFDDLVEHDRLCLFECDGNYVATAYLGNISIPDGGNGMRVSNHYIDGDTYHIYYNTASKDKIYHTTWDLTVLD